mmetsp:Transcript_17145/g.47018  ORF Transcript_17145/g.47018 Transcript_17145/m.47018 type:complete len:368 (-) Transcript_17145:219-1322(-)
MDSGRKLDKVLLIPVCANTQKNLLKKKANKQRHGLVSNTGDDDCGRQVLCLSTERGQGHESMVSLGRSTIPQISDRSIPRRFCDAMIISNEKVLLELQPSRNSTRQQQVHVNGQAKGIVGFAELKDGDVLSLGGDPNNELSCSYFIRFVSTTNDESTPSKKNGTIDTSVAEVVSEEFKCPVCLDIMVKPTSLVPCGHSFCQACLKGHSECSVCRSGIQSTILPFALEQAIEKLVDNNVALKFFSSNDADEYNRRMGKTPVASRQEEQKSLAKTSAARKRKRGPSTPATEPRPRRRELRSSITSQRSTTQDNSRAAQATTSGRTGGRTSSRTSSPTSGQSSGRTTRSSSRQRKRATNGESADTAIVID